MFNIFNEAYSLKDLTMSAESFFPVFRHISLYFWRTPLGGGANGIFKISQRRFLNERNLHIQTESSSTLFK